LPPAHALGAARSWSDVHTISETTVLSGQVNSQLNPTSTLTSP
jgi:hypothetical protein